ncbi:TauD/TfdA dioxygenase family protein [Paenirhodobacter populi]|uniref:TauD/TfdA family dioxygenase n=1 Tax=Paenirhodobacter populi TaxID=2306993 RepID=A0A443J4N0_9RHOB|nr:TauD/TfdA family dioxygenase [Sinirhodobacter populi]RWR15442.1 TauD/TfdA family dioxygenase [Sinirhodobacter populi]
MTINVTPNLSDAEIEAVIPPGDIRRISGHIGAEIANIRLSGDLPEPVIRALYALLLKHKVLFFRDQTHLDDATHEAFGARFGAPVAHPTQGSLKGSASILDLDTRRSGAREAGQAGGARADQWHTDVTFVEAYPKISILRALVVPEFGGDTVWANTVAAYERLPAPLKLLADNLWAVHSNAYDYAAVRPHATEEERREFEKTFTRTVYETEHPVVRVLETGERTLLLGNFAQRFVGVSRADSARLFQLFQDHITAQEVTVRWRWRAGDVALWDNRATQHYAVNDYGDQHRVVRRVTIEGDVPTAIDGRRSVTLSRVDKAPAIAAE